MAVDLRVVLPHRPGTFLSVCDALAQEDINLEGFAADLRPGEKWGFAHLLFTDATRAIEIIEELGLEILDVHDVEVIKSENIPGSLAEIVRAFSDRGENIEVLYTAADNHIVIGTEAMRRPITGVKVKDSGYREAP
jgi:hypothetical protein